MAAKLRNIKLREISFVDKGASGDASDRPRVAFWKRKPSTPITKEKPMKLTVEIIKKVNAAIQLRKDGMPEGAQAVLDSIKSTLSEEQWAIVEMMLAGAAPAAVAAAAPPAAKDPAAPDAEKPEEAMAKAKKAADEQAALVAKALAERLNQSAPDALTKIAKSGFPAFSPSGQ